MTEASGRWSDERTELVIGVLLQAGVLLAAAVVVLGGVVFLAAHGTSIPSYEVFEGEATNLRSISGAIHSALAFQGQGIIQVGLLILIATPVARVIFSVVAFALERDGLYVVITLIVLVVLIFSLAGGHF
jgi:uncharacterized membrane protein